MNHTEYMPAPALMPFIDRYTFMSVHGNTTVEKCIPNGFVRLYIIAGDSDLEVIAANGKKEILQDAIEGHPNEQVHSTRVNQRLDLIMCSFYPASLYQTFNIPIHHLNNQLIAPENIFGPAYRNLKEQLLNAIGHLNKVILLDNYLKKCFLRPQCQPTNAIGSLQHLILNYQGNINVNRLYAQFARSQRSLERNFLEQVGVGTKYFCRILRFNHAFAMKRKDPNKSWNEILYACGYYDQSHFIKEFNGFMDSTPEAYFRNKNAADIFTGTQALSKIG